MQHAFTAQAIFFKTFVHDRIGYGGPTYGCGNDCADTMLWDEYRVQRYRMFISNNHTVNLALPSSSNFHKQACRLRQSELAIP